VQTIRTILATIIWSVRADAAARSPFALLFTWLGALTFAVSLTYFLFLYATTFGVPAPDGEAVSSITWNVALFTVFALHHSVFARDRIRRVIERKLPEPLERSLYVWVASLLFIAVCALWTPVPGVAWRVEGPWAWGLRLIQIAGVWLTLRSAAILNIWELAGVARFGDGSRDASDPVRSTVFRTTGPYGWVRHPIYLGWCLMVFAPSTMTMTRLVFAVVSSVYLLVAIPLEERSMRSASGAYERYMKEVRWRLLPGVY
jgi:protein-S-isoprenylcysteine O-methyltransferase Ste14